MHIQQVLHGYNQGHNRISSSLRLSSIDEDRMKLLSDWSEYNGGIDNDTSYITTYPLSQDNLYVVAKTWYANEMSRPGCVWTHSLILDLDNLDDDFDFRSLLDYFHRPANDGFKYNETIDVAIKNGGDFNEKIFLPKYLAVVCGEILRFNAPLLFAVEKNSLYYQKCVLTILQCMPYSSIRKIRLCSGTADIRKDGQHPFNLQFSSIKGISTSKLEIIDNQNNNDGLTFICTSLCNNSDAGQLIRFFSSDTKCNLDNWTALGIIVNELEKAYGGENHSTYSDLVKYILNHFNSPKEGCLLKATFLGRKIAHLFTSELDYYIQLSKVPDTSFKDWGKIDYSNSIRTFMTCSYDNLVAVLSRLITSEDINSETSMVIQSIANTISVEWQKKLASEQWSIYFTLLLQNKTMVYNNYWLSLSTDKVERVLSVLAGVDGALIDFWKEILSRVLQDSINLSNDVAQQMYIAYPECILDIMNNIDRCGLSHIPSSLYRLCISHVECVLNWIKNKENISANSVEYIISYISPNSPIVKDKGAIVWKSFLHASKVDNTIEYYIYMYSLSMNWNDEFSLEMLKKSFESIHFAMSNNKISLKNMNKLSPYMAELPFWQNWDNCKKLRKGTVKLLIKKGYNMNVLRNFTSSREINEELTKIWKKQTKE